MSDTWLKHDYSAQVRTETHSASLRVRGVQDGPYNTYKPYSCSLPLTNPTVLPHAAENHDYSAQVRVEIHAAPLRVRGVQNT